MMSIAALFGHWAVIGASCAPATGFAVTPDHLTLYNPAGFESMNLPPMTFEAETKGREGTLDIAYTDAHGKVKHLRFTVKGRYLIDDADYRYRRCPETTDQVS